MTWFDQIGIESTTFADLYGARWKSKAGVLPFPLAITKFNDCNFVTVCLNESDRVSTPSVAESCIVKKDNEKMQYVKDVISERVQLKVDAYLRAMTDESSTADDMDTTDDGEADTSFDTTSSGDTDTSMEEVDHYGNASSAAAEKRKSTADQASADGTTANKVSRDATSQDIGSAKASSTTLSPELLALKDVLFDSQGNLKQDVATVVQLCIKDNTDKKELAPQELRLAGCLLKKAIDGHAEKSQVRVVVVDLHR